jgi:uncharacterized Zn finger protein
MSSWGWKRYESVGERRERAAREVKKLSKTGQTLRPIYIKSSAIATSFWGKAWCENLENYADWANRLPRGRSYARNGSIMDLQIDTGEIRALVSGSSVYQIKITIAKLDSQKWAAIRRDCAKHVGSLLDLMRGKLPKDVLVRFTDRKEGMFPSPKELKVDCSCPDYATVCKHVAATLYGVGHLLDREPELFFKMRGVDQKELMAAVLQKTTQDDAIGLNQKSGLEGEDLSSLFGIELASLDVSTESTAVVEADAKVATKKKAVSRKKDSPAVKLPTPKKKSGAKVSNQQQTTEQQATEQRATSKKASKKKAIPKKVIAKQTSADADKSAKLLEVVKKAEAERLARKKKVVKEPNETTKKVPAKVPVKLIKKKAKS